MLTRDYTLLKNGNIHDLAVLLKELRQAGVPKPLGLLEDFFSWRVRHKSCKTSVRLLRSAMAVRDLVKAYNKASGYRRELLSNILRKYEII